MKLLYKRLYLRAALRLIASALMLVVLYVLGCGPAAAWVANTVSGRPPAELDPSLYDARLSGYYRFYGPLLNFRMWLRFRVSGEAEGIFQRYEHLFCRPPRLADGRVVYTTIYWHQSQQPQEAVLAWFHREAAEHLVTLYPGTEVYPLPRARRLLVILAPENAGDRYTLDWTIEDSAVGYASLRLPVLKMPADTP